MDFNAGILTYKPMNEVIRMFVQTIVEIVNGTPTCNEKNEYHDFSIFKTGVTL
jgi:altronate hydrolase